MLLAEPAGPPDWPSTRPRPLYSKISESTRLSLVPDTQGRSAAGVSSTSAGQAPATSTIAPPPARSWRSACSRGRRGSGRPGLVSAGASHSQAAAIPGTTVRATPILVSKPRPTQTPASTSQRVPRPSGASSSARAAHQSAATEQSTSSASGLLWRDTATVIGVTASASPAALPATRPKRRRARS